MRERLPLHQSGDSVFLLAKALRVVSQEGSAGACRLPAHKMPAFRLQFSSRHPPNLSSLLRRPRAGLSWRTCKERRGAEVDTHRRVDSKECNMLVAIDAGKRSHKSRKHPLQTLSFLLCHSIFVDALAGALVRQRPRCLGKAAQTELMSAEFRASSWPPPMHSDPSYQLFRGTHEWHGFVSCETVPIFSSDSAGRLASHELQHVILLRPVPCRSRWPCEHGKI